MTVLEFPKKAKPALMLKKADVNIVKVLKDVGLILKWEGSVTCRAKAFRIDFTEERTGQREQDRETC